ncbi:MAG: tRNA (adenosine(37)-N6)-dimethylallyltransferase MiaA [Cyclobacteriaceae bacterium]
MAQPVLLVVVGPTAVGKTEICIRLAQHYGTEIISTDSRQFYREMTIGTAKPTEQELSQVHHHLVDSLSVTQPYDVKQFEQDALQILDNLYKKYPLVIATGGSGLYVKTLCEGIDAMPDITPEARYYWSNYLDSEGLDSLLETLKQVDPDYYQEVDRNNYRRVLRALEVYHSTGRPYSEFRQRKSSPRPFKVIKIGITRERALLYQRIDQRVDLMIAAGLEAEACSLLPYRQQNALHTVGYQEWFPHFDGGYDRDEAIRLIKRNSRRYAKRQWTWFRKDPTVTWFDTGVDKDTLLADIIQQVDQQISV